jgi:hypothetical protein
LAASQPRPAPSPLYWHYKPLFSAVVLESHSTSQTVIDLSFPGNKVSRNTVQLQPQIIYIYSCSLFSGAEGLLVRSQYASRRSCEQPTRFRFSMGSFCPKQNSKLVPTFHVVLYSFQAPSSSPLLNALTCFEQLFQKDKQALHGNIQVCNMLFLCIICIVCHYLHPTLLFSPNSEIVIVWRHPEQNAEPGHVALTRIRTSFCENTVLPYKVQ